MTLGWQSPALFAILEKAANAGRPCPGNADLAELLKQQSISGPSALMAKLERDGLIRVIRYNSSRVVEIVATGARTAAPRVRSTKPHWRIVKALGLPDSEPAKPKAAMNALGGSVRPTTNPLGVSVRALSAKMARLRQGCGGQASTRPTVPGLPSLDALGMREPYVSGCRWITGHPNERGSHWCAATVAGIGKPYCEKHEKMAHRVVAEK